MISSLELARICKVSQGTVDRALHDRPGVSLATKARILAAARRHGYRPHPGVIPMPARSSKDACLGRRADPGPVMQGAVDRALGHLTDAGQFKG